MSRARGLFDLLERVVVPLASRWPGLAYQTAGGLGFLRNRLSRRWPSPQQVLSLFPNLGPREARSLAWEIAGHEARNRLLVECIRRSGPALVRPLVRTGAEVFASLRPPLVLGMFHSGCIQALNVAVERLPGRVLVLRQGALFPPVPPVEVESTDGDGQRRAAAFRRALLHLKEGGFLVLALDVVQGGTRLPIRCFGRTLALARGPFALALRTGAPLRPLVAHWDRGKIGVVVGEEVAARAGEASAGEAELAAAAGRWLERHLIASPAELSLALLRNLLGSEVRTADGPRRID